MVLDPLHETPRRPVLNADGCLTNPLSLRDTIRLSNDQPMGYSDLAASTTYVSPGFEYLTDEHRLPARVRGQLRLVPQSDRVRHARVQRDWGRLSSGSAGLSYHGGHIVAVSLGGFASGPNLFPQVANFNVSAFARLENSWRQALRERCTVEVDIALTLEPDNEAPSFMLVTFWENGEEEEVVLLNEPLAQ